MCGVMRYDESMRRWLAGIGFWLGGWAAAMAAVLTGPSPEGAPALVPPSIKQRVYILPVREDINPPLVYLMRRGIKAAMEARADVLVLDMETNGGRLDVTEEIIRILEQFKGRTATFVNRKAFSAGAFIAVATQTIYMAPGSVIGAAAPILVTPGGGVEQTPETLELKMNSGVRAMVRAAAERHGHNTDVIEAMIDKNKELKIGDDVLNEKGEILTLTNLEAEKEYGDPPRRLLSAGTAADMDALLALLGMEGAERVWIEPTGAEQLAFWLDLISPLLLLVGIVGLYIEFKTPGFGLPGIAGIAAFAVYFLGGYVGGLSGLEWAALFVLGTALVVVELFVFPGTVVLGLAGAALMLVGVIMGAVDVYPGMPAVPTLPQLRLPLRDLVVALAGSLVVAAALTRLLPHTSLYHRMVSRSASAMAVEADRRRIQQSMLGQEGVAFSVLRPGGKAQFGDEIIDVITQGEMLPKGKRVRIIGFSATEAIVESAG